MKVNLLILIAGVSLFALSSCTHSDINSGAPIQKKDTGPGLLGTDANHNGIRDDIDEYIILRAKGSEKKLAALKQLAEDFQTSFTVMDDEAKSILEAKKTEASMDCVLAIFGEKAGSYEMEALSAEQHNTLERTIAAMKLPEFMSKAGFIFPEPSEWIKECRFDPSKMRN